jgi:hypothetical protein
MRFLIGLFLVMAALPLVGQQSAGWELQPEHHFLVYTDGERLPQLSAERFTILNDSRKAVKFSILSFNYVWGEKMESGYVEVKEARPISYFVQLGEERVPQLAEMVVEAGGTWENAFQFEPFEVNISYQYPFQGFRLVYQVGPRTYIAYGTVDVMRDLLMPDPIPPAPVPED